MLLLISIIHTFFRFLIEPSKFLMIKEGVLKSLNKYKIIVNFSKWFFYETKFFCKCFKRIEKYIYPEIIM